MVAMLSLSLQQGDVVNGYAFTGHWQNYTDAIVNYKTQLIRSLVYGLISTVAMVVLSFPVAYWIAFYAAGASRRTCSCCSCRSSCRSCCAPSRGA